MSSSDGFCSSLSFAVGELGSTYHGSMRARSHRPSAISTASSNSPTPHPTPPIASTPSFSKQPSSAGPGPSPSPVSTMRPASPTRSNSTSSIATQSSFAQPGLIISNPTPSVSNLPSVTASTAKGFTGPPPLASPTPPLTPLHHGNAHSTTTSFTSNASGSAIPTKRDGDSQRSTEDEGSEPKKRRLAPTLISTDRNVKPDGDPK